MGGLLQCGEELLCCFVVGDVAGALGEGALGLAACRSSYKLAQGLAADGCCGLLEVCSSSVILISILRVLVVDLEVIGRPHRQTGIRPDRSADGGSDGPRREGQRKWAKMPVDAGLCAGGFRPCSRLFGGLGDRKRTAAERKSDRKRTAAAADRKQVAIQASPTLQGSPSASRREARCPPRRTGARRAARRKTGVTRARARCRLRPLAG
jgi:hypothetical protein